MALKDRIFGGSKRNETDDKAESEAASQKQEEELATATGPDDGDAEKDTNEEVDAVYPSNKVLLPAMGAIYLAVFLVALDRTILGTAIPVIANQFQSFGDIAWYEAGFLLPLCMLSLSFGRVYTYYAPKWILVTLVFIFELGSIVCATATSSHALIVGRVVSGIGAAGITSGCIILISKLVPLQSRPAWTGGFGAMFGIASIIGPLLGGYLTSVTWRWCFWINVPIGGLSLAVLVLLTPKCSAAVEPAKTWRGRISQLDPLGFVFVAPATVCLIFALQWGGVRYAWRSGQIIALFVVSGLLFLAFIGAQVLRGENATVPPRIIRQRSMMAASLASVGIGSLLVVLSIYLPLWFQGVQGKSPSQSGLSLIPLLLSNVLLVIISGIATSAIIGYYTPPVILGGALTLAGTGLLTTWTPGATPAQWIGYQVLTGAGLGLTLQGPNVAAQTVLKPADASIGLTLLTFVQFLAGSVMVTVCQTVLQSGLVEGLREKGIKGMGGGEVDAAAVAQGGATSLRGQVQPDQVGVVVGVYNDALRRVWYVAVALAALVLLAGIGFEWKSVREGRKDGREVQEGKSEVERKV